MTDTIIIIINNNNNNAQVHVLCNHPDSEDLLAVFCG